MNKRICKAYPLEKVFVSGRILGELLEGERRKIITEGLSEKESSQQLGNLVVGDVFKEPKIFIYEDNSAEICIPIPALKSYIRKNISSGGWCFRRKKLRDFVS